MLTRRHFTTLLASFPFVGLLVRVKSEKGEESPGREE